MPPNDLPRPNFGTHPPRICREDDCDADALVGSTRCPRHVHLGGAAPQGERVADTVVEPLHDDEDTEEYDTFEAECERWERWRDWHDKGIEP